MRGKASGLSCPQKPSRITPAYAGKRNGQSPTMLLRRDHPRVCGEKNAILSGRKTEPGSPPRMRGKGQNRRTRCRAARITPAYAGKSAANTWITKKIKDHPRVCGEKIIALAFNQSGVGSPPRMRGKVHLTVRSSLHRGITPAYAGKSRTKMDRTTSRKDHPRVCGEKTPQQVRRVQHLGSPPRMRGKVSHIARV